MNKEFQTLYNSTYQAVNEHFISALNNRLDEQILFIDNVKDIFSGYSASIQTEKENKHSLYKTLIKLHRDLFSLLEEKHREKNILSFDEDYKDFVDTLNSFINSLEEKRIVTQAEIRFASLIDDTFVVSFYKFFKRKLRSIYNLPVQVKNFILRTLKKEVQPVNNWKQVIPLKNLAFYYLRDELSLQLLNLITDLNKMKAETYHSMWMLSKEIDKNVSSLLTGNNDITFSDFGVGDFTGNCYNQINNGKSFISEKSTEIFNTIVAEFESAYSKAGTIELPKSNFSDSVIEKKHKNLNSLYFTMNDRWENSFFSLFDQWRLYEELYLQKYFCFDEYEITLHESQNKIKQNISVCITDIINILENTKKAIEKKYDSTSSFKNILINEKAYLKTHLSETLLRSSIEKIVDQNLPQLVNELDENIRNKASKLSSKRSVIKGTNYAREVKPGEIESFSPVSLVKSEFLDTYFNESGKIKTSIIESISSMQKNMEELDQIAEFNLDAAIAALDFKNSSVEEAARVATEGLERAISKTNEVYKFTDILTLTFADKLKSAVVKYVNSLTGLSETEKVLQLKLRVATAKTTAKAKKIQQRIFSRLKDTYPRLTAIFEKIKKEYSLYDRLVRKKIGLDTTTRKISSEIADYLSETQSSIEKLPYVYQRLFRAEPLTDERFFEGRENEIEYINTAYNNWLKVRFAPVVIYGEKGCGATTLINFTLKIVNPSIYVYRTSINQTILKREVFLEHLVKLLNAPDIKDFEQLAEWLNNLDSRQIIIIENLQNLFLRVVDGFKNLQTLFELISKTNKNIFWITTCSLYAWEYLSKTINIQEYFSYEIPLDKLDDKQIINIIMKRHRVSGYDLYFLPSETDFKVSSFKKMNEEEQQQFLKEKFFSKLNKIIKSNISLAQLFWLRSINNLKNNKVFINSLEELDFSFLSSLSDKKIFTLAGLLIHEGLSLDDLSLVFGISEASSKTILISLVDDGIVYNDNGYYKVNPLLYRQTVNLLISKNILH